MVRFNIFFVLAALFTACDRGDMKANKLHGDTGIWKIESIAITTYDTMGNVLTDSVINEPGEFVFFSSGSASALYDYYQGVFLNYIDSANDEGYTMEYYIDKERARITDMSADPYGLQKTYTVEKFGGRKQVWSHITMHQRAVFLIQQRYVVTLKERGSF